MIEKISNNNKILSIIIRKEYSDDGIKFFTEDDFTEQLAYMNRPEGYVITPHIHNPVKREVEYTKEVLYIKSGKVRVDYYDDGQNYLESRILLPGDVVLLAFGGHGFEMLESSEIIEVKQGPYVGERDKTRFNPIPEEKLLVK